MRFWQKFVTMGELPAIVLLPFMSLASCMPESRTAGHCPPDCPMMAEMMASTAQTHHVLSKVTSSCCSIESAKPTPVAESQIAPQSLALVTPEVDVQLGSEILAIQPAPADTHHLCVATRNPSFARFKSKLFSHSFPSSDNRNET